MDIIDIVRTLCIKWLTPSDAMALRCVSKDWRETLHEKDDTLWDNLVDMTHGEETATILRQTLALRGWQLVQKIHYGEEEKDNNTTATSLKPEDVTCLIEISYRTTTITSNESSSTGTTSTSTTTQKKRKINLTSFLIENVCDLVSREGNLCDEGFVHRFFPPAFFNERYCCGAKKIIKPSTNTPIACNKADMERFMGTHLEICATFLRSDTKQSSSFVLEHDGHEIFFYNETRGETVYFANLWESSQLRLIGVSSGKKRLLQPLCLHATTMIQPQSFH